jgi:RHS repeat-associated protein
VAELRYKAWGENRYTSTGTTPTTYRYTGQREEAALGLYFYNSRWYDPAIGRFLQADSIVPNPGNPQSLNRYTYVLNSPLKYTDPTGHRETPLDEGGGDPSNVIQVMGYESIQLMHFQATLSSWSNGIVASPPRSLLPAGERVEYTETAWDAKARNSSGNSTKTAPVNRYGVRVATSDSRKFKYAMEYENRNAGDGWYNIVFDQDEFDAKTLEATLRANGWQSGQPVNVISCRSCQLAQELADFLGVPVGGYNQIIPIDPYGTYYGGTEYQVFEPGNSEPVYSHSMYSLTSWRFNPPWYREFPLP